MTRASAKADMLAQLPKLLGENQYLYIGNEVNTAIESDNHEVIGVIFRLIFDSIVGTLAQIKISDDVTLEVLSSDTYFNAKYMNSLMAFKQIPVGFIWKQRVRDMISDILTANRLRDDRKTNLLYEYDIARSGAALRKAIYNIFNTVARLKDSIPGIVTITSTLTNVKVDNPAARIYNDETYICRFSPINGYTGVSTVTASVMRTDGSLVTLTGKDAGDYSGDQILTIPPSNPKAVSFNILASGSVSKLVVITGRYGVFGNLWNIEMPATPPYTGVRDVSMVANSMPGFKFNGVNSPSVIITRDGSGISDTSMTVASNGRSASASVDIPTIYDPESIVEVSVECPSMLPDNVTSGSIRSIGYTPSGNMTTIASISISNNMPFVPRHLYVYSLYDRDIFTPHPDYMIQAMHYDITGNVGHPTEERCMLTDDGSIRPTYIPDVSITSGNGYIAVGGLNAGNWWSDGSTVTAYFAKNIPYAIILSEEEIDYLP